MALKWYPLPEGGKWGWLAQILNDIYEEGLSNKLSPSIGVRIKRGAANTVIEGLGGPGSDGTINLERFKYSRDGANGDYYYAKSWDGGTLGDTETKIARNFLLRKTPFHDLIQPDGWRTYYVANNRRHRIKDGRVEYQTIADDFMVGMEIYAVKLSGGVQSGVNDEDGALVDYLDLNLDGRAWAEDFSTDASAILLDKNDPRLPP